MGQNLESLISPSGVAVDNSGVVYVCDSANNRISNILVGFYLFIYFCTPDHIKCTFTKCQTMFNSSDSSDHHMVDHVIYRNMQVELMYCTVSTLH